LANKEAIHDEETDNWRGNRRANGVRGMAQLPNSPPSSRSNPPAAAQSEQGGKADFVTSQKPDQWLASKFKGTNVMSADNQKIGNVSDILFDKTGKIDAFVISIGGLLGMGAKEVALGPELLRRDPRPEW
jgi:PRC-barrel domain